ncbi:MAG: hypothetical protein GY816_13890 [Cytophagales bacterium]|nr:hypothetical protein [Cytophagales bacterium]
MMNLLWKDLRRVAKSRDMLEAKISEAVRVLIRFTKCDQIAMWNVSQSRSVN